LKVIANVIALAVVLLLAGCDRNHIRVPAPGPDELLIVTSQEDVDICSCEKQASTAPSGTKCRECKWWQDTVGGRVYCRCWYDWITAPQ
jgi:hypothetical protein